MRVDFPSCHSGTEYLQQIKINKKITVFENTGLIDKTWNIGALFWKFVIDPEQWTMWVLIAKIFNHSIVVMSKTESFHLFIFLNVVILAKYIRVKGEGTINQLWTMILTSKKN